MVLTDEAQEDQYPAATIEAATATDEETFYSDLSVTRFEPPGDYPSNTPAGNLKVARVTPGPVFGAHSPVGPAITLKVMAGDKFNLRVNSWWKSASSPDTRSNISGVLAGALQNNIGGLQGSKVSAAELATAGVFGPGITSFFTNQENTGSSGRPWAFVNWILFDEQFKIVESGSGFDQVGASDVYTTHVREDLPVSKSGFLYIYVSNATGNIPVFFDNLQVRHIRGQILEETHYYPFGLTMAGISSKAAGSMNNKYKFNGGTELNTDFDLSFYETQCRLYDPQIGRFWQVDELAELNWEVSTYCFASDNPIICNDPLGLQDNKPGPDDPVITPKTNMQEVIVKTQIRTLRPDEVQHFYYRLKDAKLSPDRIKNRTWRSQVERYDATAKWLDAYHAGVKKDGMIMLEIGLFFVPATQVLKLRYVKTAAVLFKFKRSSSAVVKITSKVITKYGSSFINESSKEILANRGNLSGVDWHDVLVSTATDKLSVFSKAGVGVYNSLVDVNVQDGIQAATFNKSNNEVGLDIMFNGLKSWMGGAAASATANTQNGIEVVLDQAKKTVSDAAKSAQN